MNNDKPISTVAENAIFSKDSNAKNAARRRLLRMGATVGTTALVTLASRPALACHCVMPSAWGSILATHQTDVNNLTGSVAHHKSELFESWTIHQWKNGLNNCRSRLLGKLNSRGVPPITLATLNQYNIVALRRIMGYTYKINGLSQTSNINWVTQLNNDSFLTSIFVAELNLYTSNDIPTTCGNLSAIVKDMADGSYTPASGNVSAWGQAEIKEYLHFNWLAM
jgi:hypothetical protein